MPRLESANIVLCGNFNPYIVSPEWLKTQEIWRAKNIRLALGALKKDGVQFSGEGTKWYVSSDQLVIDSINSDCGNLARKVIEKLPHTPIAAVRSNFVFHDPDPGSNYPVLEQIRSAVPPELIHQILRWGVVLHDGDVRIEVSLANGNQGTTISFSHHRPTTSTESAITSSDKFDMDRNRSEELLKTIFGKGPTP